MAEMEKEGRPPENKRSRKPAHPVKREINEEMKNFAENTMNELLGWYGYDKVELKDGEDIEFRNYPTDGESRQHISVLKENSLPKTKLPEDSVISSYNINASYPGLTTGNGLSESPAGSKEHGNVPIIVPLIPPPFIKPPAEDDVSNVQIMCAWCQKVGIKRYSLSMGSEVKCFCSEKCFAACRRAYFKRNKACEIFIVEPTSSEDGQMQESLVSISGNPTHLCNFKAGEAKLAVHQAGHHICYDEHWKIFVEDCCGNDC